MPFRRLTRKSVPAALLPIALLASTALLVPGDETRAPPIPAARRPAPPPPPAPDTVRLGDGRSLSGEVVRQGPDHVALRLPDGQVVLLRGSEVAEVQRGRARRGPVRRVLLRGGREVEGELLSSGPGGLELRLSSGALVTLRGEDVLSVGDPGPGAGR